MKVFSKVLSLVVVKIIEKVLPVVVEKVSRLLSQKERPVFIQKTENLSMYLKWMMEKPIQTMKDFFLGIPVPVMMVNGEIEMLRPLSRGVLQERSAFSAAQDLEDKAKRAKEIVEARKKHSVVDSQLEQPGLPQLRTWWLPKFKRRKVMRNGKMVEEGWICTLRVLTTKTNGLLLRSKHRPIL